MRGPVTIAVTGPFASGKSTLVRLLGELPDTETASADEIVHHLLKNDQKTIARIIDRFGEGFRGPDGIDRKALGREVFGDAEALQDLEEILHPLVRSETDRRIEASEARMFVVEIPLLFEAGRGADFDYTVAVTVPEERRRAWSEERGVDEAVLRAIESRQLTGGEKAGRADLVVRNDGDLDRLREQAEGIGRGILCERGQHGDLR
jgi:dephospho-CoA kinase